MNYILQHNVPTTKHWKYAGFISTQYFSSCAQCFLRRIKNIQSYKLKTCKYCCDWSYEIDNQHIRQPLPEHYAAERHQEISDQPV